MGRKRKSVERPELSDLELQVMDTVWTLGECSSAEVVAAFQRKRRLAPTTIRTVLANLRRKSYLEPVPTIERGFRLRPTVSRDAVAQRSLAKLVGILFDGSPRQAIAHLLKDEAIDEEELDEIRRMLQRRKRDGRRR